MCLVMLHMMYNINNRYRQDIELRFMADLVKTRRCEVAERSSGLQHKKNLGSAGLVPAPILLKMGQSRPKFPERCHPLTCPRIPNLVRISCTLPDLIRKDWFFRPKSKYNIGFQPTTKVKCIYST